MIEDSHEYHSWKHIDESSILVVNGNDTGYRNEPINIFSHAIEEKYVYFNNLPGTDAIPCYAGCWQDLVGAKNPVESMMRSLCWQLLKFPIPSVRAHSTPAAFMNALQRFEIDTLCSLFQELCLAYSLRNTQDGRKTLVILIDGGNVFQPQYEHPNGKHEAFKKAMKAFRAAVVMMKQLSDPIVLKLLLVFPGQPSDVLMEEGVISVLTLPRKFDDTSADEVRVPRW